MTYDVDRTVFAERPQGRADLRGLEFDVVSRRTDATDHTDSMDPTAGESSDAPAGRTPRPVIPVRHHRHGHTEEGGDDHPATPEERPTRQQPEERGRAGRRAHRQDDPEDPAARGGEPSSLTVTTTGDVARFDSGAPLPLADGLDRISTRVYLLAVRIPGVTRPHMIAAGIPGDAVDPAIAFLTRNGLLRPTGQDAWEAIPPELALSSLASSFEARAAYLRDAADDLTPEYHRSRLATTEQDPGLVLLRNTEELAAAIQGVQGAATQEIWSAHDDSPRTAHLFGTDLDRHRQRLLTRSGTPLRRRTTFDGRMLRHPRAGEVLRARAEGGEESRFLTDLPFSVIGADDHSAVVDLTSFDTSGAGSLLVHDRRLVLALRRLCETWWQLASPMAWDSIGEVDRDSAFILSMLAAGATDATMAAQTGLSQRTIERRVRVLMTRLGASTRFQAGVLACRRGWI